MDTDLSWGQQVAVMFQIVSTLALERPSFLEALADIWGVSYVQLDCEPWGHMDHSDGHCSCRSFDQTAAYVHDLAAGVGDVFIRGGCDGSFHYYPMSGRALGPVWVWAGWDRCLLSLIGPVLMAVFS